MNRFLTNFNWKRTRFLVFYVLNVIENRLKQEEARTGRQLGTRSLLKGFRRTYVEEKRFGNCRVRQVFYKKTLKGMYQDTKYLYVS